jgi:hypothetical protein
MDKPFGILVIVLAIFVTLGALAVGLLPPAGSQAVPERGHATAERTVGKVPSDTPGMQGAVTRSSNDATNSEIEPPQAVKHSN